MYTLIYIERERVRRERDKDICVYFLIYIYIDLLMESKSKDHQTGRTKGRCYYHLIYYKPRATSLCIYIYVCG